MCGFGECKCKTCDCMETKKYYQLYKEGKVTASEIENYIERWHNSDSPEKLHEYLGMTHELYAKWVQTNEL